MNWLVIKPCHVTTIPFVGLNDKNSLLSPSCWWAIDLLDINLILADWISGNPAYIWFLPGRDANIVDPVIFSFLDIMYLPSKLYWYGCSVRSGMVVLAPKWVRLDPKLDKSGTFSDQISVHLARWAKCSEIWSEKFPNLSNLGANLTHFGAKPTIPVLSSEERPSVIITV